MKKKIYISFAFLIVLVVASFAFTACNGLVASTKPRQTLKTEDNVLTALTTVTTLPPETYSEYLSELEEMTATPKNEQDYYYHGGDFAPVSPINPEQQANLPFQPEHIMTTTRNPFYVPRDTAFNGFSKTSKVTTKSESDFLEQTATVSTTNSNTRTKTLTTEPAPQTTSQTSPVTTKPITENSTQTVTVSAETVTITPPEIKDILDNLPSVPSDKIS